MARDETFAIFRARHARRYVRSGLIKPAQVGRAVNHFATGMRPASKATSD